MKKFLVKVLLISGFVLLLLTLIPDLFFLGLLMFLLPGLLFWITPAIFLGTLLFSIQWYPIQRFSKSLNEK